jgi:hypothetical protein
VYPETNDVDFRKAEHRICEAHVVHQDLHSNANDTLAGVLNLVFRPPVLHQRNRIHFSDLHNPSTASKHYRRQFYRVETKTNKRPSNIDYWSCRKTKCRTLCKLFQ